MHVASSCGIGESREKIKPKTLDAKFGGIPHPPLARAPQLITERGIENAESQIVCSASSVKRSEKFYYQDRS